MPRITQLENEPKNNGKNTKKVTPATTERAKNTPTPKATVDRKTVQPKTQTAQPKATVTKQPTAQGYNYNQNIYGSSDIRFGKTETPKPRSVSVYEEEPKTPAKPTTPKYNENIYGTSDIHFNDKEQMDAYASQYTPEEIGHRQSTEALLSGQTSKGSTVSSNIEALFDGGYKMSDEELKKIGGVYLDKNTGEKLDDEYVDSLFNSYTQKADEINGAVQKLSDDHKNGLISDEDYVKAYQEYEKQWNENQKYGSQLDNVDYKYGMDYYNWLKENGTVDEVKKFEKFVSSYDDSMLESLANAETAVLVNMASRPVQAYEMLRAVADREFDYSSGASVELAKIADEYNSYTLNGRNDQGIRKYSLQTVESLLPMINDTLIATWLGGAVGIPADAIGKFASTFTNVEMGLGSMSDTLRTRLAEGNTFESSIMDAGLHGLITAMVEGLNVGGVTNLADFLVGGAGKALLGGGLFSLPNIATMLYNGTKDFFGEGIEEVAEAYLDKYIDDRMSYVFGEPIQSEDVTWGGIGDNGLLDQFIMAGAGAFLMGAPQNINLVVDSAKKYSASGEAVKYWKSFSDYYAQQGDLKSASICNSIANVIEQERRTYQNISQTTGVQYVDEMSAPAPTVEEALNAVANAFKLDVNDQMQNIENMKQVASQSLTDLNTELERRGYGGKLDVDTYLKADPEVRQMSKNILDFANQIGADVRITDNFDYLKSTKNGDKVVHKKLKGNESGVTVYNDTIVINPFAKNFKTEGVAKAMIETLSHELTHTTELTDLEGNLSESYQQLEKTVRNVMGDKAWNESFNEIKKRYGSRTKNDTQVNREVVANYIGKNIGSQQFLQTLANYNSSAFTKIWSGMKALLNQNAKVANDFFKAYEARMDNAMKHSYYTNVYGNLVSAYDCQFNVAQYKETGKDILTDFIKKQVEKGALDKSELDPKNKDSIINRLDWYANEIDKIAKDPDHLFDNFAQWSNVSMSKDHKGYPQLTCVVANGEYKMNIDFSTVCKKRKVADAVFNEIAKMGVLDGRALTQEEIGKIRAIVKKHNLEVACSLCFVDSKRFNQGGWADTLVNGKEDKINKNLVKLGAQDAKTKHIFGWNEMVDLLANDPSEIGEFNFAGRESVNEGTLHTLDDSNVNQKGLRMLKKIAEGTSSKSEVGKIARALLNHPELRRHMLLGDLYGSEAFGQIKRGVFENNEANEALFKIINAHQGVAKPKSPYLEVTYNNEIIKSKTFDPQRAREVGGVRIQSFSDYMANMVFDYMECIAELQAKGLTAHAYTKVKEFAELFGQTGIKINLSIIPRATTMSSKEFLQLSDAEKEEVKKYAGLEKFSLEEVEGMSPEEKQKLIDERGLGLSEDGSCYTAYIFEDESFNWLDALELQTREGYDKNVGTICVGVSDEHIWKMMADDNVKQIIPYHKSSLNHIVAQMMNIGAYNDFTDYQNTRVLKNGEWKSINSDDIKGTDFAFYTDGMLLKNEDGSYKYDAKESSYRYLQWCAEKGYLPKFDQFAYIENPKGDWVRNENGSYSYVGEGKGNLSFNENYYKVLIDFRAYDANNNLAPQESVKLNLPENFMDMVRTSLMNYEEVMNNQKAEMPSIVNEVVDMVNESKESDLQREASEEDVDDGLQFFFGGEKTVNEMIESSDEETHDRGVELKERLDDAKKMFNGSNYKEVWNKTGWIKKADDKWRFEFFDGAEEFIDKIYEHFDNGYIDVHEYHDGHPWWMHKDGWGAIELSELVGEDNALLKMYPDLADYRVTAFADDYDNTRAEINDKTKEIIFNLSKIIGGVNSEGNLSIDGKKDSQLMIARAFFHELQHAIQTRENFDDGSSLEHEAQKLLDGIKEESVLSDEEFNRLDSLVEDYLGKKAKLEDIEKAFGKDIADLFSMDNLFDLYQSNLGETEARNSANRTFAHYVSGRLNNGKAYNDSLRILSQTPLTEGKKKSTTRVGFRNTTGLTYRDAKNNISSFDEDVNNGLEFNVSDTDDAKQIEDNILSISDDQIPMKTVKLDSKTLDKNKVAQVLRDMPEVKDEKGKWKRLQQIMEHEFLDHLDRIVELSKEYKNPQIEALADYAMMAQARANEAITDKRREFVIDKKKSKAVETGESLNDIIGELNRDQIQTLGDYLYNWRNVDSMTKTERLGKEYNGVKVKNTSVFNKGQGVTADESRQRIAEIEAENPWVKERAERLWEFSRQNLKLLLDAGIVSKDTYDYYQKATPHYIPIQRNVDGGLGVQQLDPNKADLKFKGSSEDILPLDHNLITHTQRVYNTIAQNALHNEIMNTVGNLEEMTPDEIEDVFEVNFNPLSVDEKHSKKMFAYKNGKKFSMPVDERLYNSLAPLQKRGFEFKTLQNINNFRRNLITGWNPMFAFTNYIKDYQDAWFNTKHPFMYPINRMEAIWQIARKGELYKLYKSAGGGMNSYVNEFGVADIKGDNVLKKAWKGLLSANEFVETIPRLAEFIASIKDGNTLEQAMLDASEVTTNFKRGGDTAKYLNRNGMAFFNASLQGYRRQLRNLQDAKDGGISGMLTYMAKLALTQAIPLYLINHLMWKDDKDYEELSDYVKQNYYIVKKYGDGKFIRIPKGRISAFYQTVMENAVDTLSGKVKLWDGLMSDLTSFVDNVAPNNPWENFIAKPLYDAYKGQTWYGGDLLSSSLKDKPKSEQFDEDTDDLSKAIGRLSKKIADATGADFLELSPKKVNYVLDQYSGGVGDIVLPALTLSTTQATKVPFANAFLDKFTTDSVLKNQNVTDLYSLRDKITTKANSLYAKDEEVLSKNYLYSISSEMGKLYGKMHEIQADASLSTKDKFEQARDIKKKINELAKTGLANYDQIDLTGRYASVGGVAYYKTDDGTWRKLSKSQLENVSGISDEDKSGYFKTFGEISDARDKIKEATPKGQKADYTDATIDAIRNSDMSASGKNALFDSYYDSKGVQYINDMNMSDEQKLDVKIAMKTAVGEKDENGKTIANSKAEATAEAYRKLGVLDDILIYIKDNNIKPSELGLSNSVYKKLTGQSSGSSGGGSPKKKTSSKSSKTSSSSKKIKVSGGGSSKKLNLVGNPKKETLKKYFNAYQSVFGRGSKNVATGGSRTVTCPNCGAKVPAGSGRCPVCGATL